MKKNLVVLLALMMLSLCVIPAFAADVQVVVDGQTVEFADQKPYIDSNDRTLVPMRAPMEAIGATVSWDAENQQASFEKDAIIVVFTIGSSTYTINGAEAEMDTAAVITGDRTCIPIRYAAEALGASVSWNSETSTVEITSAAVTPADDAVIDETADDGSAQTPAEDTVTDENADDSSDTPADEGSGEVAEGDAVSE